MSRSRSIDFVRGVAILLVLGAHLDHLPQPSGWFAHLAQLWIIIGWLGVDLFFVLSGFLIGGILLRELRTFGTLLPGRFLIRRGLKIYPLYVLFIAYLVAMPTAKAYVAGDNALLVLAAKLEAYWPNLLFLHTYVGDNPAGHTWSLAVEEHFYLSLPFALLVLSRTKLLNSWLLPLCFLAIPILACGTRVVSTLSGADYADTMSDSLSRFDALLFGVGLQALSLWRPEVFAWIGKHRFTLVTVGVLCWFPVLIVEFDRPFWFRTFGLSLTFIGAGAFIIAALHVRATEISKRGVWFADVVSWIGVYSYGIYLWHITIMGIVDGYLGSWFAGHLSAGWAWSSRVIFIVVSACVGGAALSRLVEWPVLRLRDRLYPARSSVSPSVAVEVMLTPAPK